MYFKTAGSENCEFSHHKEMTLFWGDGYAYYYVCYSIITYIGILQSIK